MRWLVCALALLLTGLAWADPVVHLTPDERARLELYRFRRGQGQFPRELFLRPDNVRLFLALVEESKDAKERAAAVQAVTTAYSPNPAPGLVLEGKRYELVPLSAEYREVTRNQLGDRKARADILPMASACLEGTTPDASLYPILDKWFTEEFSADLKGRVLKTACSAQTSDPAVAALLGRSLQDPDPSIAATALACIAACCHRGVDYGSPLRARIEALYGSPRPELRSGALAAAVEMTPKDKRRSGLNPLFRTFLRDPAGPVVGATLVLVTDNHAFGLLKEVCALLGDTRQAGDQTPVQHFALRALALLSEDAAPGDGFRYEYVDRRDHMADKPLDSEAVRAQMWVRAHRKLIDQVSR